MIMKKAPLLIIAILLFACGYLMAQRGPRFVRLQVEQARGHDEILQFETFHDNESGVEFICAVSRLYGEDRSISCFRTGRVWK